MRCAFCNRRIRGEDWTEFRTSTGVGVRYHYAETRPHRNCDAVVHYLQKQASKQASDEANRAAFFNRPRRMVGRRTDGV